MVKNKRASYANADSSPLYYLGRAVWSAVRFFFLLGMTFVILYPLLYMLSMSLRAGADMYDMSVVWIPKHFTLDNFRVVFEQLGFGTAMLNTIEIALGCAVIQVFVCALTGYGFARFPFKGRGLLFLVVIFTIVVPPQMTNLPNYLLFHDFDFFGIVQAATGRATEINLLDRRSTLYLLALLGQGIRSGLFILIFRQYFRGVPMELEQAAMVDGCGFGRHRQPGEAFDGGAVQSGGLLWQAFEDRPFRDPQRSGIAPPPHQEAEALRPAPERPHRAPAAEAFAGPQVGERVDVEPDPGVGGVPMPVCGVAPCRHRSIGRGIAAPVGGKSFDSNFVRGPDVPRHGGRRRPELCRGESRREEQPHGGRLRTEQQRHDSRAYESPCEKPQGQFIPASQRDPDRERHEEFQDGHAVEPREQAGEFHWRWVFIRA